MNRLKVFDRALLEKQIGGLGIIVIIDVTYLVSGVFFGFMDIQTLFMWILFANMLATCLLYHSFIVSRGDMRFELNTEKIVYYPTTRFQYLLNKYAKTLIFVIIQWIITIFCLVLGYFGNKGEMDSSRIIGGMLMVYIAILMTSGISILVMHTMPLGIYLSMLLYFPLIYFARMLEKILEMKMYNLGNESFAILLIGLITTAVWVLLLWIGVKVFERVT
ncbi:MAG: hypothetical protein ACYDEX_16890 [Mobilitalea sp.]